MKSDQNDKWLGWENAKKYTLFRSWNLTKNNCIEWSSTKSDKGKTVIRKFAAILADQEHQYYLDPGIKICWLLIYFTLWQNNIKKLYISLNCSLRSNHSNSSWWTQHANFFGKMQGKPIKDAYYMSLCVPGWIFSSSSYQLNFKKKLSWKGLIVRSQHPMTGPISQALSCRAGRWLVTKNLLNPSTTSVCVSLCCSQHFHLVSLSLYGHRHVDIEN